MNASPDQRSAILVTGGSRGIGREIALEAARRGYNVALTYNRDCDAASAVVENVEAIGGRALALRARAEAPDEMEGAVADAYASLAAWTVS